MVLLKTAERLPSSAKIEGAVLRTRRSKTMVPAQTPLHIVSSRLRHNNGRWFVVHQVFSPAGRLGIFKSIAAANAFLAAQSTGGAN